jgi:hypothetical protein
MLKVTAVRLPMAAVTLSRRLKPLYVFIEVLPELLD